MLRRQHSFYMFLYIYILNRIICSVKGGENAEFHVDFPCQSAANAL